MEKAKCKMENMKTKKSKIIIISLLILVVLIAAGFALNSYLKASAKPLCWPYCPNMTDQDRIEIKQQMINAQIVNWKTYRNDKYGFTLMYPQDWTVLNHPNSNLGEILVLFQSPERKKLFSERHDSSGPIAEISVTVYPAHYRLDTATTMSLTTRETAFNGFSAIENTFVGDGPEFNAVLIDRNDYTYDVSSEMPKSLTMEVILSTFKFISP